MSGKVEVVAHFFERYAQWDDVVKAIVRDEAIQRSNIEVCIHLQSLDQELFNNKTF